MNNYDLKIAYDFEDITESQHEILMNLRFEVYSVN